MTASENEKQSNIKINISDEVAKGHYSNMVINKFSQEEFILDFAMLQPHTDIATIQSRQILTPRNAKKLLHMLEEQIQQFEKTYGEITESSITPPVNLSMN